MDHTLTKIGLEKCEDWSPPHLLLMEKKVNKDDEHREVAYSTETNIWFIQTGFSQRRDLMLLAITKDGLAAETVIIYKAPMFPYYCLATLLVVMIISYIFGLWTIDDLRPESRRRKSKD